MSDGIRSGVNWMRENRRADDSRQSFYRQSFRRSGNAFEKRVSFGENGDENLFDNFVLPDDHFAKFVLNMCDCLRCVIKH